MNKRQQAIQERPSSLINANSRIARGRIRGSNTELGSDSSTSRNRVTHTQEAFRKDVGNFYEVIGYSNITADRQKAKILLIYSVAAQAWFGSMLVKAAHLVPKNLESPELSIFFGGDVNLSNPRNGN